MVSSTTVADAFIRLVALLIQFEFFRQAAFSKASASLIPPKPIIQVNHTNTSSHQIPPIQNRTLHLRSYPLPFRIVGGEPAFETELPYQVSLQYYNNHRCGGAIIGASYILTSAHCVIDTQPKELKILAGFLTLSLPEISTVQIRKVTRYIIHSKYQRMGNDYDIAIIKLRRPFVLNSYVNTAVLPNFGFEVSSTYHGFASGWGRTEDLQYFSSDKLKVVRVPIVPHRQCEDSYIQSVDESLVKDTMICAGEEGKDSCQGDSGGPLAIDYGYMDNGKPLKMLVGITAFGDGCGKPGFPGVYMKVAAFREWISAQIGL